MKQLAKSILELNERYVRSSFNLIPTWIKGDDDENQIIQLTNEVNNLSIDLNDSFKTSQVIIYDKTNIKVTVDNFQKIANKEPTYLPIVIEAFDSFKDRNPLNAAPHILLYVEKRIKFHQAIYKKLRNISSDKVDVLFKSMNYDRKEIYPIIKTFLFLKINSYNRANSSSIRQEYFTELQVFLSDRNNFKQLLESISAIGFSLISSNSTYTSFLPGEHFTALRLLMAQVLKDPKVEFGNSMFLPTSYKNEISS